MKIGIISAIVVLVVSGCSLNKNIPKATISYDPISHEIKIASHKDISITNLNVTINTNGTATFTIGNYESRSNIEVVRAAVESQQQQIKGSLETLDKILSAAGAAAK